jgi:hypothetical protein
LLLRNSLIVVLADGGSMNKVIWKDLSMGSVQVEIESRDRRR